MVSTLLKLVKGCSECAKKGKDNKDRDKIITEAKKYGKEHGFDIMVIGIENGAYTFKNTTEETKGLEAREYVSTWL